MKISTFKYYFFIFHFTIKNVLIDTGSPSNMPVDMSILPNPHVHGAPSSEHHGFFLNWFLSNIQHEYMYCIPVRH